MSKEHAYAYEAGYRDGSINYELEHCPACKNVADLQEALAENAKLRKLVTDYFNAPCVECNPWDEGWQGCKHCDSGNCNLAVRALKLGVEVTDG